MLEAKCHDCGETFIPDGPDDLDHAEVEAGVPCGGTGVIVRRTYAKGDSVRDTKWGGEYTGTITRVDDDGAIFVQWHGTCVEDQLTAADLVPAPDVPRPGDNGLRYLTFAL